MTSGLHIVQLEHAPSETTLFIHYTVEGSGLWEMLPRHCGYRGVCDTGWYIMYPNSQHPRHTDTPIQVNNGLYNAIFAWNYGGIRGIDPVDFTDGHSYLVQLALMDIHGCQAPLPTGNTGSYTVTGYTGMVHNIEPPVQGPPWRRTPIRPVVPTPNTPPWPYIPFVPFPPFIGGGWGGGGGSGIGGGGNISGAITSGSRVGLGLIRDGNAGAIRTGDEPVHLRFGSSGITNTIEIGRIHTSPPIGLIPPDARRLMMPPVRGGDTFSNIEPPRRPSREFSIPGSNTPLSWEAVNPENIGFNPQEPSLIFGDGGQGQNPAGYGSNSDPVDRLGIGPVNILGLMRASGDLEVTRMIPPGGKPNNTQFGLVALEESIANPYPISVSLPIESLESDRAVGKSKPEAGIPTTLGGAEGSFINPNTAPVNYNTTTNLLKIETANLVSNALTLIMSSKDEVTLGEKVSVSSIFAPPQGSELYVTSEMHVINPDGSDTIIAFSSSVNATNSSPATVRAVIDTSRWKLGGVVVLAVYKDPSSKIVGYANKKIIIRDASITSSLKTSDGYRDSIRLPNDTIPSSVKNLADVSQSGIKVYIPADGGRGLLFSKYSGSSSRFSAMVLAKDLTTADKITIVAAPPSGLGVSGYSHPTIGAQVMVNAYNILARSSNRLQAEKEDVRPESHQAAIAPVATTDVEMAVFLFAHNGLSTEADLHPSKGYYLKPTTVVSSTRLSDGIKITYDTPYVFETIRLLVMGYQSGELPLSPTYVSGVTNNSGRVMFTGISGSVEQYIGLISQGTRGMYNPVSDIFYTNKIDV